MPHINSNGVSIFYRILPQTGAEATAGNEGNPPLLLLHGFMQRSQDWFDAGYVDQLNGARELLLVDARGHGLSEKPHGISDYRMELLVSDLLAVLDELELAQVDFMGYSFGAWVGFGMARFAPERLRSLVLGGMHPYVRDPGPLNRRIDRFTKTRDALAAGGHHADLIPDHVKAQFEDNDIEALISLTTAIRDSRGFDEALDSLAIPALIYAGEDDPAFPQARECVTGHNSMEFLSLPELGHMDAWHRSDLVLPQVLRFLRSLG